MIDKGISIILPTKDREIIFAKTLAALIEATKNILCEIIIVNDSKTNAVVIDSKYTNKVIVINNPKIGLGSARNHGAKHAKYPYLLHIDNDMIVSEQVFLDLLLLGEKNPKAAINVNWIYPTELTEAIKHKQFGRFLISHGYTSLQGWSNNLTWKSNEVFEVDLIASYFLLISKEVFYSTTGYSEAYPPSSEDFEFAKQLKQKKITCLCNPLSMVYHNEEDRIDLIPWLNRKKHSAKTRRVSFDLGNKEMILSSNVIKKNIALFFYQIKPVFFLFINLIPNYKIFDKLYFFIINRLLSAYLYSGYYRV